MQVHFAPCSAARGSRSDPAVALQGPEVTGAAVEGRATRAAWSPPRPVVSTVLRPAGSRTVPGAGCEETAMTVIDKIAWIRLEDGAILSSRSRGKDVYYLPGGKREAGESDIDTLTREIAEELSVTIIGDSAAHLGTFHAQAHGHPDGTIVRMTCYTADYRGTLQPAGEIEEIVWLTHADRHRVSPVDQLIFDHVHRTDGLR